METPFVHYTINEGNMWFQQTVKWRQHVVPTNCETDLNHTRTSLYEGRWI